jgi:hypothetical protein
MPTDGDGMQGCYQSRKKRKKRTRKITIDGPRGVNEALEYSNSPRVDADDTRTNLRA